MLNLEVLVPAGRDRSAVMILTEGSTRIREEAGAASSLPQLAASRGNPACEPLRPFGHPPFGSYLLLRRASAPEGCEIEYGFDLLLFEAQDGDALEAESFGRLALLVYAGPAGHDALMRRTQGGVRVSAAMMSEITRRLGVDGDMRVRIGPLEAPAAWWQFWKRRYSVRPEPLSMDAPHLVRPPLDEMSLIAMLLQDVHTRRRPQTFSDRDDDRGRYGRDSSSASGSESFRGGGGEYAGAGASGSWGDAPAGAGRGVGADGSGRIIGAAAAVGIAALAAAEAGASDAGAAMPSSSADEGESDSGTRSETSY